MNRQHKRFRRGGAQEQRRQSGETVCTRHDVIEKCLAFHGYVKLKYGGDRQKGGYIMFYILSHLNKYCV